jgi:ribosomal protein L22
MTPSEKQTDERSEGEAPAENAVEKKAVAGKSAAAKKPAAAKQPAAEKSGQKSAEKEPAKEAPAKKEPATATAANKKPAAKASTGKQAVEGKPAARAAAEKKPAEKKPAAEKPAEAAEPAAQDETAATEKPATARAPRAGALLPRRTVVRAQARYVRTSARKARMVCGHLRGKSVEEARAILAFTPREVARDWAKLLESAVANAENNHELVEEDLLVREAFADEGPTIKRFRPRAQGRAAPIRKRTSHLTITLTPRV